MISAQKFYEETVGMAWDIDHAYGVQCHDLAQKLCDDLGVPKSVIWCGNTGYAHDIWDRRNISGILDYFYEITDPAKLQNGDMVIFPTTYSMTPLSHVCFYYQFNGKKYAYGQRQGGNREARLVDYLDFNHMAGAFRFKKWETKKVDLPYGKSDIKQDGLDITIIRGNHKQGYDLHIITAPGENARQDIMKFDAENLEILGAVNGSYFQMSDGRHLGNEGDGTVRGYQQIVPTQKGWLAYFQRDGQTAVWKTTDYYYDQSEVDWVITPYAVRLFHGDITYHRSTNCGDKDDIKNTQTFSFKFDNGDWAIGICRSKVCPRDIVAWGQTLTGIQDIALFDSGGSTQMFECITTGKRQSVLNTGREITNVLVIAKKIKPVQNTENEPEKPGEAITTSEAENLQNEVAILKTENEKLKNALINIKALLSDLGV